MVYRCIIIEDEVKAKEVIERYIEKVDYLELIGYCQDGLEALNVIPKLNPDIIFLDINMPNINGLELLSIINKTPNIIITTAYSEYALDSYDFDVVDYLLKPIEFSKFIRAISRIKGNDSSTPEITSINKENSEDKSYLFKSGSRTHKVYSNEILFLKKDGNYLEIHLENGKKILIRSNMKEVFEMVSDDIFVRTHKSYVVNINKIQIIEVNKLTLTNNIQLPLGASYRKDFNKKLESR